MQVIFNASDFNHGMSMVSHAQAQRPTRPFQDGVYLETREEGLQLTCTDGEVTITSTVPAVVREDGVALLPAKLTAEWMRSLSGEVELTTQDNRQALVKNAGSKTILVMLDAEDFPDVAEVEPDAVVTLSQQKFKAAVSRIIFAISTDETRRILTGCLMEISPEELRFVCLDGYRLAMQRVYVAHELPGDKDSLSYILPGKLMKDMSAMIPDSDQPLTLTLSKTHFMAQFGKTTVYSPLILGEYINYKQILPTSWTTAVKADRQALLASVDRAAIVARDGSNNLLKLAVSDQLLTISANAERAEATEQVPVDFDGNPLNIAFNAAYLTDVIKNIDTPDLAMRFNTNVSPCVVCPVSGNQYTYLILPVRVAE